MNNEPVIDEQLSDEESTISAALQSFEPYIPQAFAALSLGTVVAYPYAPGIDEFTDMRVSVHDAEGSHEILLYSTPTNPKRQFPAEEEYFKDVAVAMFDMTETVIINAYYPKGVESAVVRPARAGIEPVIEGNTVSFAITEWGQYTLEFNDDPETDALLIFASPPTEIPDDARVITGEHNANIRVNEGQTLYLAPGAVVNGQIILHDNSKVMGRGIVKGSGPPSINVMDASNITIEGISIFDPSRWVVQFLDSTDITVENIKIISARNNGDGITIQSSGNITIEKSFIRSWDDGIVIKNYTKNNSYNIIVRDCVIWTDLAQSIEIGFETNKGSPQGRSPSPNTDPQIYDVVFENIDIIHNFHKAPISIHNADGCRVYNITFRNIIVDNAQMGVPGKFGEGGGWPYLIDFANANSGDMGGDPRWTWNDGNREIRDVLVENVWVLGGSRDSCQARFMNTDSGEFTSIMENIELRNIYFKEEPLDYSHLIEGLGITQHNAPYFHWSEL